MCDADKKDEEEEKNEHQSVFAYQLDMHYQCHKKWLKQQENIIYP